MTDKQIIIDGIDVSGCCQYMPRYMEDYDIDTLDYCRYHFKHCKDVDVKYCYYKQLKCKEQECERLKEDIERWKSNFNGKVSAIEELLQQLDQLKAENKHLSEKEEEAKHYLEEAEKFKNCLTEIKKIAEKHKATAHCDYLTDIEQILQKISESEVRMTTNREKLNQMTNEELARFLTLHTDCSY